MLARVLFLGYLGNLAPEGASREIRQRRDRLLTRPLCILTRSNFFVGLSSVDTGTCKQLCHEQTANNPSCHIHIHICTFHSLYSLIVQVPSGPRRKTALGGETACSSGAVELGSGWCLNSGQPGTMLVSARMLIRNVLCACLRCASETGCISPTALLGLMVLSFFLANSIAWWLEMARRKRISQKTSILAAKSSLRWVTTKLWQSTCAPCTRSYGVDLTSVPNPVAPSTQRKHASSH